MSLLDRVVWGHLIHMQLLSCTQVRSTLHERRVSSVAITQASLCIRFPPAQQHMLVTRDPATHLMVQTCMASCKTHTEVRGLRCVAKGWSNIEPPYGVVQHRMRDIAAGYEARFQRQRTLCHEVSGASLHCHCNMCRAFTRQPPIPMLSEIRVHRVEHVLLHEHW